MQWLRALLVADPGGQRSVQVLDEDDRVVVAITPDAAMRLAADLLDAVAANRLGEVRDRGDGKGLG